MLVLQDGNILCSACDTLAISLSPGCDTLLDREVHLEPRIVWGGR